MGSISVARLNIRKKPHIPIMVVSLVPDEPNGEYRLFELPVVLLQSLRKRVFSESRLTGIANLLIMPNLSAANNSSTLMGIIAAEGVAVRPII